MTISNAVLENLSQIAITFWSKIKKNFIDFLLCNFVRQKTSDWKLNKSTLVKNIYWNVCTFCILSKNSFMNGVAEIFETRNMYIKILLLNRDVTKFEISSSIA